MILIVTMTIKVLYSRKCSVSFNNVMLMLTIKGSGSKLGLVIKCCNV